ncbi:MAG: S8 family serine peptidase [Candidatus Woesearchaeota archaeon]
MLREVVIVLLVVLLATSVFAIDKSVLDEIGSNGEARVIVVMKENSGYSGLAEHSRVLGKLQSKSFGKTSFALKKNLDSDRFVGVLSKAGLDKIKNDPAVSNVYLDKKYSLSMDVSKVNTQAVKAHGLVYNGVNLTGAGQTVCVIDTGVDYMHSSLGSCTPTALIDIGNNDTYSNESAHPYADDFDYTWTVTMPGYTKIALHFVNISMEYPGQGGWDSYDRVIIYDSAMREIAVYHGINGVITNLWTPYADGDTLYVRLVTDTSVNSDGFFIDYARNGTTSSTYDWSSCSKVIGGWDAVNNDGLPLDDEGHGTHVAGTIVSSDATYTGIAYGANLVSIKALDSSGDGWGSDIMTGIDWCVNNSERLNISVISMSIGGGSYTSSCDWDDPLLGASIDAASAKGIAVVVASGNSGSSTTISSPACMANAIPISAVTDSDTIASFSNRNNLVKLFAPGVGIISTQLGGGFVSMQGTSMATPHAAGAFALLKQYNSSLSPFEIENILYNSGYNFNELGNIYSSIKLYDAMDYYAHIAPVISINPVDNIAVAHDVMINITSDEPLVNALLSFDSVNHTMNNLSSINWEYNITNLSHGNHSYNVYAYDKFNNVYTSLLRTIVSVNNAPVIDSYYPNDTLVLIAENSSVYFNHTSSDADFDNLTYTWKLDDSVVGTAFDYTYTTDFFASGYHNVTLYVTDGYDVVSQYWNVSVSDMNRPLSIELISNVSVIAGQIADVNVSGGLNISDPDGDGVYAYSLGFGSDGKWSTSVSDVGNYSVVLNLSDTEYSDTYEFYVFVTSCVESWSCSSWTTCASSSQTRSCSDANSCGTTSSKPAESQSCTMPSTSSSGGSGGGGGGGGGSSSNYNTPKKNETKAVVKNDVPKDKPKEIVKPVETQKPNESPIVGNVVSETSEPFYTQMDVQEIGLVALTILTFAIAVSALRTK